MGENFFFSVETLVLRHRQEIASLTVSRLHVSHARQVLCGCNADLVIYRFEVRLPLNAEILSFRSLFFFAFQKTLYTPLLHQFGNILSFLLPLFQEGQLSVTGESMCTKYWLTA